MTTFNLKLLSPDIKKKETKLSQYSDYNQNPVSTGPAIVTDLQTIKQSLDNLFHARRYERRYMHDYYVPINELIGELYEINGVMSLLTQIISYIEYNEPRVKCYPQLSSISVNKPNLIKLTIVHEVPSISSGTKYSYSTEITME